MPSIKFNNYDITKFAHLQKNELLEIARIAENAERYEDMCEFMKDRVTRFPQSPLDQSERNLLSVAYKNVIGNRRASWRVMDQGTANNLDLEPELLDTYKKNVEKELVSISDDVLDLLKDHLIKEVDYDAVTPVEGAKAPLDTVEGAKRDAAEAQVFYLKMAGDYYRYLTESVFSEEYKSNTEKYYEKALKIAEKLLPETHPIRLGLALNYSVCYYEILNQKPEACKLAKKAFDEAISKLDKLDESDYKDSTLIMQLLRDNLTLWTNDQGEPDEQE